MCTCTPGKKQSRIRSVSPTSQTPTSTLTKVKTAIAIEWTHVHTGENAEPAQKHIFKPLGPEPIPNQGKDYCHAGEKHNSLRSPAQAPSTWYGMTIIEPGKIPSSHLTLDLDTPTAVVLSTKKLVDSTPLQKTKSMLTSDAVLLPKPLSTCRLHMDTCTQGHPFKTRIGDSFT